MGILICFYATAHGSQTKPLLSKSGPALVAMARCKAVVCLDQEFARIKKPDATVMLVYYSKLFELDPDHRAVSCSLLATLPKTEPSFQNLTRLAGFLYSGESVRDIDIVGTVYWHLPRQLTRAVELCPVRLNDFILFGRLAIEDPHSGYPEAAAKVCRRNPPAFLSAFRHLPSADQAYLKKYVISPQGCRQIAVSEAE